MSEVDDIITSWIELTKKIEGLIQENKRLKIKIRDLENDKRTYTPVKRKK